MAKFYETVDGKEKPLKFTAEQYNKYRDICLTIWGGLPYDYTWAIGTLIYQKAEAEWLKKNL